MGSCGERRQEDGLIQNLSEHHIHVGAIKERIIMQTLNETRICIQDTLYMQLGYVYSYY